MTKKNTEFNDILVAVNNGFTTIERRFDKLEDKIDHLETRVCGLENDMRWVKDILEKHTTILKALNQERLFMFNRQNRLETRVEKLETV